MTKLQSMNLKEKLLSSYNTLKNIVFIDKCVNLFSIMFQYI
jgi:hypothetical protein